jgi:hypothetical protein
MGKRLVALLAALLLIAGAVVARNVLDSGGDVTIGRSRSPVVCDPLVITACRQAFEGRTVSAESPGDTLDRLLAERDPEPFLWVTADVWLEILEVESARISRANPAGATQGPLVVASLMLAATRAREDCDALTWACLADQADTDPGLRIGIDRPDTTIGLLTRGELVAGFLGRSDFATNDLDSSTFRSWSSRLGDRMVKPGREDAFRRMATQQGGMDVAPVSEVDWSKADRPRYEAQSPADSTRLVSVVAVPVGGAGGGAAGLSEALEASGWRPTSGDAAAGQSAPVSPGVLQQLRSYWD